MKMEMNEQPTIKQASDDKEIKKEHHSSEKDGFIIPSDNPKLTSDNTVNNSIKRISCDGPSHQNGSSRPNNGDEDVDPSNRPEVFAKPKPKNDFICPKFAAPMRQMNKVKKVSLEKQKATTESEVKAEKDIKKVSDNEDGDTNVIENIKELPSLKLKSKSPSIKPSIPYTAPDWSETSPGNYYFDVLKGGVMKNTIDLDKKPFYLFGRMEGCDVLMEHPSISRYHAVVVYRGKSTNENSTKSEGFYIMDLGSTHGTFVNKTELDKNVYFRLRVGYLVKFGGSTRLHILQGPETDQEEEIDKSTFELKKEREIAIEERSSEMMVDDGGDDLENKEEKEDEDGISWGMGEDAVEEEMDLEKLLADKKPFELKDPKKTLRGFFEREGLDLEYETDERGSGNSKVYVARVKLPIEDASGEELVAEGSASKKKEAVAACAFEACRIIDAHGMLRNAMHESERSKRAKMLAENDYYDSDEDSFLDRTGSVEVKRQKRLKRAGKAEEDKAETYESLVELLDSAVREIDSLQETLEKDKKAANEESQEDVDDLDHYMQTVTSRLDKKTRVSIKLRLTVLHKERRRLEKLIAIVKPVSLPSIQKSVNKPVVQVQRKEKTEEKEEIHTKEQPRKKSQEEFPSKEDAKIQPKNNKLKQNPAENPRKSTNLNSMASALARIDPANIDEREVDEDSSEKINRPKKSKKKKVYGAQMPTATDSKFADWVPPSGQLGDGKTHLNEKFGY